MLLCIRWVSWTALIAELIKSCRFNSQLVPFMFAFPLFMCGFSLGTSVSSHSTKTCCSTIVVMCEWKCEQLLLICLYVVQWWMVFNSWSAGDMSSLQPWTCFVLLLKGLICYCCFWSDCNCCQFYLSFWEALWIHLLLKACYTNNIIIIIINNDYNRNKWVKKWKDGCAIPNCYVTVFIPICLQTHVRAAV